MSEGQGEWVCAECKAPSSETLEERADRLERVVKELRKEIRKKRKGGFPSDHAKRALKGVNQWAGAFSKTLGILYAYLLVIHAYMHIHMHGYTHICVFVCI